MAVFSLAAEKWLLHFKLFARSNKLYFIILIFSGLWAVVHLAGTGVKTSYQKGGDDEQQLRTALEVTVVGMLRLVRACLPHLSAAKGERSWVKN